jgi:hypothetical protein
MNMQCPYRGLQPLSKEDEPFFAGREKEIRIVISNLDGSSLTILYGESGVGKTSLIRAGVLPELERNGRVAAILFRDWQSPDFERQLRNQVLQSLLDSINRTRSRAKTAEPPLSIKELHEAFCTGLELPSLEALYELPFHRFIQECSAAFYGKISFIFDQFEEYIYYHPLKGDGDRFDSALASAINDRQISASFLLSLREDGLGKLDRLRGRIPDLLGNVVRLEHLDKEGARRAIDKPLEKFSEGKDFTIEAAPELKEALLEQVDADRLEMDETGEARVADLRPSDSGVRYKALALQAVLTQLWDADVSPVLNKEKSPTGTIRLRFETLCELARNKKKHETEVRFLIRTYFDDKLDELTQEEAEATAEILRGLVRAGGHKRARTAQTLAEETMLPRQQVEALLRKLSSEPFRILRQLESSQNSYYELNHDVMAFAVMDWSNRRRQTVREERQKQEFFALEKQRFKRRLKIMLATALVTILTVAVLALLIGKIRDRQLAAKEIEQMQQKELLDASSGYLGILNRAFRPYLAMLTAIDSIAKYRQSQQFVSLKAVVALALANAVERDHIAEPKDMKPEEVLAQIPCVESADPGTYLVVKDKQTIELRTNDGQIQHFSTNGKAIKGIGFNLNGDIFGVWLADGEIITRKTRKPEHPNTVKGSTLAAVLGISDPAKAQACFRTAPDEGWTGGYDDIINSDFLSAISRITAKYPQDDRRSIGGLNHAFTDELNDVYEALASGQPEEAIHAFTATLSKVNIDLDPELEKGIAIKQIMERGNTRASRSEIKEAKKAYGNAVKLDPTLRNRMDPETEWMKFAPGILADARQKMNEGYAAATAGDRDKAVQLFTEAIRLDDRQLEWLDPKTEAEKNLPPQSAPSSATPTGASGPVPSGSPDAWLYHRLLN